MKICKLLIFYIFFLFSCISHARDFTVAIRDIEAEIKPDNFQHLAVYFILYQLHETLFMRTKDGITSNILSSWQANNNYNEYTICLKDEVLFSNGKKVTNRDIEANLNRFIHIGYISRKIVDYSDVAGCLKVKFSSRYYAFMDDMQVLRTAIIDPETENYDIPVGISPYTVDEYIKGKELVLKVANHVVKKPYFDKISLAILGNANIDINVLKKYHEINLLSPNHLFNIDDIREYFTEYKTFDLVGIYLILNNLDFNVRKLISDCINRPDLAIAINKKTDNISSSFVPLVSPSVPSFVQECKNYSPLKNAVDIDVIYYWSPDRIPFIQKSLERSLSGFNIMPKVNYIPKSLSVNKFKSKNKKYEIAITGIGGPKIWNYLYMFGFAEPDKRLISFSLKNRADLLDRFQEGNAIEKNEVIREFFSQLKKEYRVIPIAEASRVAFYPKRLNIYNNNMNNFFCEYKIKDL